MSLTKRTLLVLLAVGAFYVAAHSGVAVFIAGPASARLEEQYARQNMERALAAVDRELEHLETFCADWAAWDDTCAFIEGHYPGYETTNLVDATFTDNGISLIHILDREGRVVYGRSVDIATGRDVFPYEFPLDAWPQDSILLAHEDPLDYVTGLMDTELGPMLVASCPVVTSENEGPIRGSLVMGRLLDEPLVLDIAERVQAGLHVHPLSRGGLPGDAAEALPLLDVAGPPLVRAQSARLNRVYALLRGLHGEEIALVYADFPRWVSAHAWNMARIDHAVSIASALLAACIGWMVLEKTVNRPISRLTAHVEAVAESGRLDRFEEYAGSSEIARLAAHFNYMTDRIKQDVEQIRAMSERAVRAEHMAVIGEMGASVAHEVRNPLAAMSAALQVIRNRPGWTDADREVVEEVVAQVARVDKVIDTLLLFSKTAEPNKAALVAGELVADIVSDVAARPGYERIVFSVKGDADARMRADPVLLAQALWNLFENAAAAMGGQGEIEVGIEDGAEAARFTVRDRGEGIAEDLLDRVARPFFTTRANGTGLGLPICARIVEAHGGAFSISSTVGEGTLVSFTIPRQKG